MENSIIKALYNAYGSKKNFEKEMINLAFKIHYHGSIYLKLNNYLNLSLDTIIDNSEYEILKIDLEQNDIYNFIEELDYEVLDSSYNLAKALVKSK